ncbi:hypothetical protein FIU92_20685 (plasmid) [Ruegeria sp. THAF33]|nr:hypothetical protein FIU92_20685 [Ruegeria sp. THAF33]
MAVFDGSDTNMWLGRPRRRLGGVVLPQEVNVASIEAALFATASRHAKTYLHYKGYRHAT